MQDWWKRDGIKAESMGREGVMKEVSAGCMNTIGK